MAEKKNRAVYTLSGSFADNEDGVIHTLKNEPEYSQFTSCIVFANVVSIIGNLANTGTDIATSKILSDEGNSEWFILTLILTIIPRVIVNCLSLVWYWQDDHTSDQLSVKKVKNNYILWTFRLFIHMFLMGPVLRYLDLLKYGYKSPNKPTPHLKSSKDYYTRYINHDRDVNLLELIQSFLGDAFQLVLQIYMIVVRPLHHYHFLTVPFQISSACTSLFAIASSMASYHKALRFTMPNKRNLSGFGTIFQFFWRSGTILSRVLAFALFASEYQLWFFVLLASHWLIMFVLLLRKESTFFGESNNFLYCILERLVDATMAGVLITCYINLSTGPTKMKCLLYYSLLFVENAAMALLWYFKADPTTWYHIPGLITIFVSFLLGIIFMVLYYSYFHPNCMNPKNANDTSDINTPQMNRIII